MRGATTRAVLAVVLALASAKLLWAQEIIDRIVARVENEVILSSDVRALSRYQQFVDGKAETDEEILNLLIDQWIVQTEADISHFRQPSNEDIDGSVARLRRSLGSAEEYEARKKQCGLSDAEIRKMAASQLYLSAYLDSRFRPGVQIDSKAIEAFYQTGVLPQAKARGEEPPSLDASRDLIQEALVQRAINEQADQWLKESRLRLHIEKPQETGRK